MVPVKFNKKTLPQKEGIGEKLAKKRVSLGYSIKDAEKATRIRAIYLESLENGNYDRLPPAVYVKGFIKSYCKFLKLDAEKVMTLYLKERGMAENLKKVQEKPTTIRKATKSPKIIITPKRLIILSVTVLALLIASYIGWQVKILTAPPQLVVTSPADNITVDTDSVLVEGNTDPSSILTINDIEVGVLQDGQFKEKVSLQRGVNTIKIKSENKLGKYNEATRVVVAEIPKTLAETTNDNLELTIAIGPKSASVQLEIDGKKLTDKPVIMLAGVSSIYRAKEKIVISTNNAGSVQVTLNGEEIGLLGQENESLTREFVY